MAKRPSGFSSSWGRAFFLFSHRALLDVHLVPQYHLLHALSVPGVRLNICHPAKTQQPKIIRCVQRAPNHKKQKKLSIRTTASYLYQIPGSILTRKSRLRNRQQNSNCISPHPPPSPYTAVGSEGAARCHKRNQQETKLTKAARHRARRHDNYCLTDGALRRQASAPNRVAAAAVFASRVTSMLGDRSLRSRQGLGRP